MKKLYFYINVFSLMYMTTLFLFPHSSRADSLDDWLTVTTPTNDLLYGVAYGNNTFVAVGSNGIILTSPDGIVWTPINLLGYQNYFFAVTYGNGKFVAVGSGGTVLTSTDGVYWTTTYMDSGTTDNLYGVTCGNGKFVAVGSGGTILTSSTGLIWMLRSSGTTQLLYDTIYGNSIFVDVGTYGTTFYSTNGLSWTPGNSTISSFDIRGVAYGNYIFIAVGDSGTILTSLDGVNWTVPPDLQNPLPSVRLRRVTYCTDTFIAVGDSGTILTSLDGVNWTERTSGTLNDLDATACDGNSSFVAVGTNGTILISGVQTLPVRILGVSPGYSSIQAAYDGTINGETIESQALHFSGNLVFDRNVTVTLQGGYDSTYTTNPSSTTINGALTISDGTVKVENIIIK
jgi:photosystem II stability/assembly factor-like uncharacterized protein